MFKTPPRSSLDEDLRARLDALESHSIRRQLRPISSGIGPRIVVDGRSILQFCSNDYLGITSHPAVTRAAEMALSRYGTGAGSARLVVGTSPLLNFRVPLAACRSVPLMIAVNNNGVRLPNCFARR